MEFQRVTSLQNVIILNLASTYNFQASSAYNSEIVKILIQAFPFIEPTRRRKEVSFLYSIKISFNAIVIYKAIDLTSEIKNFILRYLVKKFSLFSFSFHRGISFESFRVNSIENSMQKRTKSGVTYTES